MFMGFKREMRSSLSERAPSPAPAGEGRGEGKRGALRAASHPSASPPPTGTLYASDPHRRTG